MPTPYDEGFRARLAGKTVHECPYAQFTREQSAWCDGWRDQDEHQAAKDEALNSIGWFG